PWARVTAWDDTLVRLGAAGYVLVALSTAGALDVAAAGTKAPLAPLPERVALLLGNEGDGLRPATLAAADVSVRVPMAPGIDSLNGRHGLRRGARSPGRCASLITAAR